MLTDKLTVSASITLYDERGWKSKYGWEHLNYDIKPSKVILQHGYSMIIA